MSIGFMTPHSRDTFGMPTHMHRPPRVEGEDRYTWERNWELIPEFHKPGYIGELVKAGHDVRRIHPSRALEPDRPGEDYFAARERKERARRVQVDAWASGFIAGTATIDEDGEAPSYPEDREAMLYEVVRRLREATSDGFLLRALQAVPGRVAPADSTEGAQADG